MSKRSRVWTNDKKRRYIQEGRGTGEGKEYMPWLRIQDFPSLGCATRILSNTTNRIHHFFSDLQTKCFYLWEWDKNVIDIREHYPLLDLDTVINTNDINLDLFKDKKTGENYVITTTFLLTVKMHSGDIKYFARSVKSKEQLNKKITSEKLEIERRYWQAKGIHWAIITEENIPAIKVKNIEWLHGVTSEYKDYGIESDEIVTLCSELLEFLSNKSIAVRKVLSMFDKENNLIAGTGIFLFKYLVISGVLEIDLNNEIDLGVNLENLLDDRREN